MSRRGLLMAESKPSLGPSLAASQSMVTIVPEASSIHSIERSDMSAVATAILTIAAVAVAGLALGSIRICGIGLGSAGVLFAGIISGHFGAEVEPHIAHFAKEFGLVLFVFAIVLHLGPGIFQLWREQGLVLNAMAISIVTQGFLLVILAHYLLDFSVTSAAGLFSGATTNTPSLGAAQQAAISLLGATPEDL